MQSCSNQHRPASCRYKHRAIGKTVSSFLLVLQSFMDKTRFPESILISLCNHSYLDIYRLTVSPVCFPSFVLVLDVIRIMFDTNIRDGRWPGSMEGQSKTN